MRTFNLIFALTLLAAFGAQAQPLEKAAGTATFNANFGLQGETLTVTEQAVLTSRDNETKEEFLLRISRWFTNWTTGSGWEICSKIYQKGNQFAVVPATSHSKIGCLVVGNHGPDGFTVTDESIHSHPINNAQIMTKADVLFRRGMGDRSANRNQRLFYNNDKFSGPDIEGGAGYLVAEGKLYYQNIKRGGPKTLRTVGDVPPDTF